MSNNGLNPDGTYNLPNPGGDGAKIMPQPKYRFGQTVVVRMPDGSEHHAVESIRRVGTTYLYEWKDVLIMGVVVDRKAYENSIYESDEALKAKIAEEEERMKHLSGRIFSLLREDQQP
jgi:hypothetical protein